MPRLGTHRDPGFGTGLALFGKFSVIHRRQDVTGENCVLGFARYDSGPLGSPNKMHFLTFSVKRITGKARLQFTRVPYTHWSLSFYSEPILELEAQSQFQGRQLQPQIISLIINQIRRAVKRKHTLPRYKMRYKPFFRRLNDEVADLSEVSFCFDPVIMYL